MARIFHRLMRQMDEWMEWQKKIGNLERFIKI